MPSDAIEKAQIEVVEAIRAQVLLQYKNRLRREGLDPGQIYMRQAGMSAETAGYCESVQGILHTLGAVQGHIGTLGQLRVQGNERGDRW